MRVAASSPTAPTTDRSDVTAAAAGDPDSVVVDLPEAPSGEERTFEGTLDALSLDDGVHTLRVADETITVRGPAALPLSRGDAVRVRFRSRVMGRHRVVDAVIESPPGRVVLAGLGSGDASFLAGWSIRVGPIAERERSGRGGAARLSHWVVVARGAHRAYVADNQPRRLRTDDGEYVVGGHAVRWGRGPRPPDSASYELVFLMRGD